MFNCIRINVSHNNFSGNVRTSSEYLRKWYRMPHACWPKSSTGWIEETGIRIAPSILPPRSGCGRIWCLVSYKADFRAQLTLNICRYWSVILTASTRLSCAQDVRGSQAVCAEIIDQYEDYFIFLLSSGWKRAIGARYIYIQKSEGCVRETQGRNVCHHIIWQLCYASTRLDDDDEKVVFWVVEYMELPLIFFIAS